MPTYRTALAIAAAGLAAACSSAPVVEPTPAFYQRLDQTGRGVDPASSLSMINQYRGNLGAPPLRWDPTLARVAQAQADRMAAADKLLSEEDAHTDRELAAAGVRYKTYRTNLSAGYRTFAEAFSGWRELKTHNANMTNPQTSLIGLATAAAPSSKYKIFWVMVVVEPA
jgi:uncharacterized protein YkwD